jgi:predicted negative regulator of RcsB-dependent stress response
MAYDLEEQEQIAKLRAWWNENGTMVIVVVVACLVTIAGFQGWRYYRYQQAVSASKLFQQLEEAGSAKDHKRVRDIATQIEGSYRGSTYAALAALSAARASIDTGDLAAARTHLKWVIDNAGEEELVQLGRLRLARVLFDEKQPAEALAMLDAKTGDAFTGLYADLRGDILMAQGKAAEARSAYRLALDRSDPQSAYRAVLQAKLDALGEAK